MTPALSPAPGTIALVLVSVLPLPLSAQAPQVAAEYIPKLERNLTENILPFWLKTIDRQRLLYHHHNAAGVPNPKGSRGLVTQTRQVWLFSTLARNGYQLNETLAAARHGFRFLRDRMWDKKNGGFYWEVDATGTTPVGQAGPRAQQAKGSMAPAAPI